MQLETVQFSDQIAYIDNGLLDSPGVGSTYVVRGDELAIIETGTSRCAPNVLDGLRRLGIDPAEVRHIVLTHVHMDHAGGTGTLLQAMPEARAYIHSKTAPYLVDPAKLVASAERALGELFSLHGPVEPVAAERIVYADDLRLDLGRGVVLRAIYTPGHSPDHLAYFEEQSGCLFTGDSLGIVVPRSAYAGPVTPPPAFKLADQRATFEKLRSLEIETLLFSHYGPSAQSPRATIELLHERFEQLVTLVQTGWAAGHVDHAAVIQALLGKATTDTHTEWLMAGWIEMSINGLVLFFERQAQKAREAEQARQG
jgi:glyoxylase-like metal-dependent hydrolase (beta-lactamase superfamily II)